MQEIEADLQGQVDEFWTIFKAGLKLCRTRSGVHFSRTALFALIAFEPEGETKLPRFLVEYARQHPDMWKDIQCDFPSDDPISG